VELIGHVLSHSYKSERVRNRNNQSLYLLSLIIAFVIKYFKRLYSKKKGKILHEYQALPKKHWQNDYPIVLVHGFGGFAPDESLFFGDYFGYASDP
jgi:hypothetical protein